MGIGAVGTGVETAVGIPVGTVVGTGEVVGVGWAVWVRPAAASRTAIAQASATSNEVFILAHTRGSSYKFRDLCALFVSEANNKDPSEKR